MILEKAIKTIILTYCIDVIFDKISRNFQILPNNSINIQNFIFIHYTRYLDFIYLRNDDFAFHSFMEYIKLNHINIEVNDCLNMWVAFWDKKEGDEADASMPPNHSFDFWNSTEDDGI